MPHKDPKVRKAYLEEYSKRPATIKRIIHSQNGVTVIARTGIPAVGNVTQYVLTPGDGDLKFNEIIQEINENSIIQIIVKNKEDKNILDLLDELIQDHKEQSNLKKIESLEQKLINNLDENSYSELMKLKSQLNRE